MTIDWKRGIPKPLPDDLLAEIRRDARSDNYRPELFVVEQIGDRPQPYDPETSHEDRDLTHKATATARRDDLQQDLDDANHAIAKELPRKATGCLTIVLLVLEWAICRDLFMNMGWSALAANGMAFLVTLATAFAVSAVRRPNTGRRES
ncbi:MAG: hypothetical protein WC538_00465 [Thermoanaerobaculia bacterium]|jgi:hypothetical protein